MNQVGVVIVSHNSAEVIGTCLDSCASLIPVVVDNGSADTTITQVERRPFARIIANADNRGFAAAANQGVEAQDCEFILLLNPDVELTSPIQPLIDACRDPHVAIASGQLLNYDGRPQVGFTIRRFPTALTLSFEVLGLNRLWPGNPVNRRYRYLDADFNKTAEVEQPPGAFLFFRRGLWIQLGGFDTRFHPLWFEDVDFCKRARDSGLNARYVPEVTARHLGGHSIAKLEWRCREVYWYASLLKYAFKHFRKWSFRGVSAAVVFGSILRLVSGVVIRRSFQPVAVYARVGGMAARSLILGRMPGSLHSSTPVSR